MLFGGKLCKNTQKIRNIRKKYQEKKRQGDRPNFNLKKWWESFFLLLGLDITNILKLDIILRKSYDVNKYVHKFTCLIVIMQIDEKQA